MKISIGILILAFFLNKKCLYLSKVIQDSEKEEEELRKALEKIYQIRRLRNEMRLAARAAGNKENIRRAAHMKMLASSAQTIPLWVGRDGEEPPELCGCLAADPDYIAEPVSY